MTTIAWDGESLAADRRITESGIITANAIKIRRTLDGRLIGGAGNLTQLHSMLDWLEKGGDLPDLSEVKGSFEVVEIYLDGSIWIHDKTGKAKLCSGHYATGSGSDFALAAMALGKNAKQAVIFASKFDTGTGSKVDVLKLKE